MVHDIYKPSVVLVSISQISIASSRLMEYGPTTLPSKTWSCSTLAAGASFMSKSDGVLLNSINKIYQRTLGANTHASYVPVAVQSMVLLNELNKSATAL